MVPALHDGGYPVTTYAIYRLDGLTWTWIGTAAAPTTTFTDSHASPSSLYYVTAINDAGSSPPSPPTDASRSTTDSEAFA